MKFFINVICFFSFFSMNAGQNIDGGGAPMPLDPAGIPIVAQAQQLIIENPNHPQNQPNLEIENGAFLPIFSRHMRGQ